MTLVDPFTLMDQIDPEQFDKVLSYIKSGNESGATLETGGNRIGSTGYFVEPTVFSNVTVKRLSYVPSHHFFTEAA